MNRTSVPSKVRLTFHYPPARPSQHLTSSNALSPILTILTAVDVPTNKDDARHDKPLETKLLRPATKAAALVCLEPCFDRNSIKENCRRLLVIFRLLRNKGHFSRSVF